MVLKILAKPRLVFIYLVMIGFVNISYGGTNEGFEARISGSIEISNAALDDLVRVPVDVIGTSAVKGGLIRIQYDSQFLSYEGFVLREEGEDFIPGVLTLPKRPETDASGLNTVEAGFTTFGEANNGGDGHLGTMGFKVTKEIPAEGTFISVVAVQLQRIFQDGDIDILDFELGQFGVALTRTFPNRITDVQIIRSHDQAAIRWKSRIPSTNNQVVYSPLGSDGNPLIVSTPEPNLNIQRRINALAFLRTQAVDLNNPEAAAAALRETGLADNLPENFFRTLLELNEELKTHQVRLPNLEAATQYEFQLRSTGINNELSPAFSDIFRTRAAADLRPLEASDADIQIGQTAMAVRYKTNRNADTRYSLTLVDSDTQFQGTSNTEGTTSHLVVFEDLTPNTEYVLALSSHLVDADLLI